MTKLTRLSAPALLLASTIALALGAPAAAAPGCLEERVTSVAFSAPDAADTATTTVVGPDCEHAVVILVVREPSGVPVYEDVWPIVWFSDNSGAIPSAAYVAERVRPRVDGYMNDQPDAAEIESDFQWLEVPGAYFNHLRETPGAILCYETGHESGSCAAFDASQAHGVRVLSSGS